MSTTEMKYDSTLDTLLRVYTEDPSNPESNFALALHYDKLDQKAAAVSYYTRAAERSTDKLFQYECLIKAALCFEWQGTRGLSVRGLLQRAITVLPQRPEAYFFLARWFEREHTVESWVNCYTQASIGLAVCDLWDSPLRTDVGYPGYYGLLFEKAVSGWWVGLCDEAKDIFIDLHKNHSLDYSHRAAVINNLKFMNQCRTKEIVGYNKSKYARLKYIFDGAHTIEKNFAESYQDMFVLAMMNGKKCGTYLEIGSARPFYGNNTALLEQTFGWRGVSVDLDQNFVNDFNANRKNPCIQGDATKLDYEDILGKTFDTKDIDYLQIDVDPAEVSLAVLKRIPFDKYRFATITFEHDAYAEADDLARRESRAYLQKLGYVLVGANIAPDQWRYYEDWWVHPEGVNQQALNKLIQSNDRTKTAESFLLND